MGILLAKKWVDEVIDINRVSDRMNVIKMLVQRIIVSVISVYVPQYGLDHSQKDDFYDSLINVARKLMEQEIVVITVFLEVTQKIIRTSMEVMVMELGTRKGKRYLSLAQL